MVIIMNQQDHFTHNLGQYKDSVDLDKIDTSKVQLGEYCYVKCKTASVHIYNGLELFADRKAWYLYVGPYI